MTNEPLLEHLRSLSQSIEEPISFLGEEFEGNERYENTLNYFYFAPQFERMSLHVVERKASHRLGNSTYERDILSFKPYFDNALNQKKITSIIDHKHLNRFTLASSDRKEKFLKELAEVENSRGILNALLTARNWGFFPKGKGSQNRSKLAKWFIARVIDTLYGNFNSDKKLKQFLKWCGKRTRKRLPWGFKPKEIRSPQPSTLPIHQDEAASYIKHFLHLACNPIESLWPHYAEMTIFLSLCLACARQHSNGFTPTEILKITKDDIAEVAPVIEVPSHPLHDDIENSKSKKPNGQDVLLLKLSPVFLENRDLWPEHPLKAEKESHQAPQHCKIVNVNGCEVLISKQLAVATELMGKFTLSLKDVGNRLKEAFDVTGLKQSSGGISPRCFLFRPHTWEGIDTRKDHKEP